MKKILDPKNLPYFGAIVQAVLFAIAGSEYFPVAGWLVGLGVGAVVNWSMAIASSRISDIAKNRKLLGYLSLFALVCVSPVIICSTLGWSVANFSWAIAADLSITLTGSIVGKGLVSEPTPKKSGAGAKPKKQSAAQSVAKSESATHYPRRCEYCPKSAPESVAQIKSPNAVGGHMKKHHPELCKPKRLAENLFEKVVVK